VLNGNAPKDRTGRIRAGIVQVLDLITNTQVTRQVISIRIKDVNYTVAIGIKELYCYPVRRGHPSTFVTILVANRDFAPHIETEEIVDPRHDRGIELDSLCAIDAQLHAIVDA
jgi:hypothetical protein